ncbi:pantoate--beta-alanine ligase [Roseiconus lacunae]|uniref:pantoate--beta-alanine ligase n=1 Tax=Roseiconus lacunae TaxID=2605694 RepID=UPI0011F2AEC5|nr:pantoate--beta-alanine ligase [Roseiconus lacunae]
MQIIDNTAEAHDFVRSCRRNDQSVGVVLTMGALHQGHLSLVEHSRKACDHTIATIFVNPTQFAPGEDLDQYPRTIERDVTLLGEAGCNAVLIPDVKDMYPAGASTSVNPPKVAEPLEGQFRPSHFGGVATVVLKFFQILPGSHAFFGRKDYQQCCVIKAMVEDFKIPIEIIDCPIVREADGLAMSSRNRYLSESDRRRARCLSMALADVQTAFDGGQRNVQALTDRLRERLSGAASNQSVDRLDYAVIVDPVTLQPIDKVTTSAVALIAAHVGTTRLIDNCVLDCHMSNHHNATTDPLR